MKLFMLANLSILVFWFGRTTSYSNSLTLTLFLLSFFYLSLVSLGHCLVPGGFAWSCYSHAQNSQNGFNLRGPAGWPILGFLPHHMGSLAHQKLSTMATSLKATRLMAFSLGTTRVIISSHPDTARQILGGSSFSDRPIKQSAKLLMFERAIGFCSFRNILAPPAQDNSCPYVFTKEPGVQNIQYQATQHRLRRDRSPSLLGSRFGDEESPGEEHQIGEFVLADLELGSPEEAA